MSDDFKNIALITLYKCDIKPVSLLNIHQKTKVLKNPLMVLFDTRERYSCVRSESFHLGNIQRRRDTLFYIPNGTFESNKESEIE